MSLTALPLLQIQKDLLQIPRGTARFQKYLQVLTAGTQDIVTPIMSFNPMSKDHVESVLDQLLAVNAESILVEILDKFGSASETFNVGWVVIDDIKGGWTCRETIEMNRIMAVPAEMERGWLTVPWWCSDLITDLRLHAMTEIFRSLEVYRKGPRKTLGEIVDLEKRSAEFAGFKWRPPQFPWSKKFESHFSATDLPTIIAVYYGDSVAEKLGYIPLGFPNRAGSIWVQGPTRGSSNHSLS